MSAISVDETVRRMICADPERFPHREACLDFLFCTKDNGFEWRDEDGRGVVVSDTFWDTLGESWAALPDEELEYRMTPIDERMREERGKAIKRLRDEHGEDWWPHYSAWKHEQFRYSQATISCLLLQFPDYIRHDWMHELSEVIGGLYDDQSGIYNLYKARCRRASERHWRRIEDDGLRRFRSGEPLLTTFVESVQITVGKDDGRLDEVREGLKLLYAAIAEFRAVVWDPWLRDYYRDATRRNHSARLDDVELLMWGAAGRVMVTLRPPDDDTQHITLLGYDEEGGGIGFRGIDATIDQAVALLSATLRDQELLRAAIVQDDSVQHPAVAVWKAANEAEQG